MQDPHMEGTCQLDKGNRVSAVFANEVKDFRRRSMYRRIFGGQETWNRIPGNGARLLLSAMRLPMGSFLARGQDSSVWNGCHIL